MKFIYDESKTEKVQHCETWSLKLQSETDEQEQTGKRTPGLNHKV